MTRDPMTRDPGTGDPSARGPVTPRTGTRRLAELSGPATATALGPDSVVVLPIGAIEHHGPHLPLVTDALIAESVATAAVDRAAAEGLDVWQLPTLSFAKSDEHSWASGTVWLRWETLMETLVDIGRSVAATPARRLVLLNGHGGNTALLGVALRELRRRFGLLTFAMPAGIQTAGRGVDGEPDEQGLGIHAGFGETSLVLHLRPDLVDLRLAERNVPAHVARLEHLGFNGTVAQFGWLSDDFGPSGVIGDPTGADAATGARLFAASVDRAVGILGEIAAFSHAGVVADVAVDAGAVSRA
jgi:creatinine amidohydrolase